MSGSLSSLISLFPFVARPDISEKGRELLLEISSLNLGGVLKPTVIYNVNVFMLQCSISIITSWGWCSEFWKMLRLWCCHPPLTSCNYQIHKNLVSFAAVVKNQATISHMAGVLVLLRSLAPSVVSCSETLEISRFIMVNSERGRNLGALAASALTLPGRLTMTLGRKTDILSSKSMYYFSELPEGNTSSVHNDFKHKIFH